MEETGSVAGFLCAFPPAVETAPGLAPATHASSRPQEGTPAAAIHSGLAPPHIDLTLAFYPSSTASGMSSGISTGIANYQGKLTAAYQSGLRDMQMRQTTSACHPSTQTTHIDLRAPAYHSGVGAPRDHTTQTDPSGDLTGAVCPSGLATPADRTPAVHPQDTTGGMLSASGSGIPSLHPGPTGASQELSSSWPMQAPVWNQSCLARAALDAPQHADSSEGWDPHVSRVWDGRHSGAWDVDRASLGPVDGIRAVPEESGVGREAQGHTRVVAEHGSREFLGQKSRSVDTLTQSARGVREERGDTDTSELEKQLKLLVLKRQVSAARCGAFLEELQAHKDEVGRKASAASSGATAFGAAQRRAVSRPRPGRYARLQRQPSVPKLYAAGGSLHGTGHARRPGDMGEGGADVVRSPSLHFPQPPGYLPPQQGGVAGGHEVVLRKGRPAGLLSLQERNSGGMASWSTGRIAGPGSFREANLAGPFFQRDGTHGEASDVFREAWGPVSPSLLETHVYYSTPGSKGGSPR